MLNILSYLSTPLQATRAVFDKSQTIQFLDSMPRYEPLVVCQRKIQSEHSWHSGDPNSGMMVAFQHLQHEVAFILCVWDVSWMLVSWQWRGSAAFLTDCYPHKQLSDLLLCTWSQSKPACDLQRMGLPNSVNFSEQTKPAVVKMLGNAMHASCIGNCLGIGVALRFGLVTPGRAQ